MRPARQIGLPNRWNRLQARQNDEVRRGEDLGMHCSGESSR